MGTRRSFLASGGVTAFAAQRAIGANERIRLGIIGPGARGQELLKDALAQPNVELGYATDIYTARLREVETIVPGVKTAFDYRRLLEEKNIDAVLIATPQHLHCEHFTATLDAGKHCYQEKTMAFTVAHAKRMREARRRQPKLTVQIGHQSCSFGQARDAAAFLARNSMGKVTMIEANMYRNTPHGKPQWSRPVKGDMTAENILWKSFLGEAPNVPFDANRYINWRFFWDYSGGNVYENMCHQLSFWYKLMNLKIPAAVTMRGGVYLWKDGREVPDTMNVTMEHSEEILFSWNSGFGNDHLGFSEAVLGTDATLFHNGRTVRLIPQKVNQPNGVEEVGATPSERGAHMKNFLDSIRGGQETNCPFDVGFRVSIACRMAVDSYRLGKTVKWDAVKEETYS
ncbi:MAG: Gfo/Idh/MocA family oxidoreductase [Bryobacter sp.]|jgi:predicted dehydrogenase|nr:Gfo/Idh/MocA family oxidoreductase [Bryobacter sp. CoA8 C33]